MMPLLALALVDCVAGTAFATVFSASFLTLPAVLGVRRVISGFWPAPLARGSVERNAVGVASLLGALGAVAFSDAAALAISSGPEAAEGAGLLLGFVAPVPLAAVPWMAGEVLSGTSLCQVPSLVAAMAASCAASWAIYALCWKGFQGALSAGVVFVQVAGAALPALLSASAYLATRGAALAELPVAVVELDRL